MKFRCPACEQSVASRVLRQGENCPSCGAGLCSNIWAARRCSVVVGGLAALIVAVGMLLAASDWSAMFTLALEVGVVTGIVVGILLLKVMVFVRVADDGEDHSNK